MSSFLQTAASIAGSLCAILTAAVLIIRPVRERVLGIRAIVSGVKCLLRSDMLRIYYKGRARHDTIRQHERENLDAEYKAYKALGGNSFIDDIYCEIKKWSVET